MPRQEERLPHFEEIELEFSSGKRSARVSDISMGGCYIDSIVSLPVGEPISFVFKGSGSDQVRFTCKVAYVLAGFGFGVQFADLSSDAETILRQMIKADGQSR